MPARHRYGRSALDEGRMTAKRYKISCCVPYCPRTFRKSSPWAETICGKHYRRIPLPMRKAYKRAVFNYDGRVWPHGVPRWLDQSKISTDKAALATRIDRMWERLKREACARATDLGDFL
jgi:hypothetical protein